MLFVLKFSSSGWFPVSRFLPGLGDQKPPVKSTEAAAVFTEAACSIQKELAACAHVAVHCPVKPTEMASSA